jgi:ribosome-associated toxin RatA of RatAB toxin-antitoxin module
VELDVQTIKRSHMVPFSAEQMYKLVDDINNYKNFIQWCSRSEEHERSDEAVTATLALNVQGMEKSFTTKNQLTPHKKIDLTLVDGPFSHLEGFWQFDDVEEGCKVDFQLTFDISNKLLAMFIGPLFEQAANSMLDIFIKQAEKTYEHES